MSDVAEAQASAGTLLRRAREAAGMHVAALAVSLKVPVRKLEALEEDRYDDMGDAVFIRALASSVCRTLKIDPRPILDRLPQTTAPRLVKDDEGLNTPFRAPSDAAPPSWTDKLRQPVPLAVIALLLAAVVVALLPIRREEKVAEHAASAVTPAPASASGVAPVTASAPEPEPAASGSAAAPVAVASQPPGAPAAVQAVAEKGTDKIAEKFAEKFAEKSAAPASAALVVAAPAAAAASGIVVFRAKGESWVEVVDAKGVAALRKLLAPGESAGASGALPLQVTIGKVDMTEVQVRGKPFDLKSVSRDNVARFQVK